MHNWRQYFFATRPAFLTITVLACLIGIAQTASNTAVPLWLNTFGVLLAVLGHAAANVINDYYDALNGTDACNTARIFPFTGGSRFIQDGVLSERTIQRLSLGIFAITILGGLLIAYLTTWQLIWVGTIGLVLGWSYSATPVQWMSRGLLGEMVIALCWTLIVVGAALLNQHAFSLQSVLMGLAYGLFVANILFVNQIPDIVADESVGKITLAVRLPRAELAHWYLGFALLAYALLGLGVQLNVMSLKVLLTLAALPFILRAAWCIQCAADDANQLKPAIVLTILSAHIFGIALMVSAWW